MADATYSKQLISEIEKHIDPVLSAYFYDNVEKFRPYRTMKDMICHVMEENFNGRTRKIDLLDIIKRVKSSRVKKRSRWYSDYKNDLMKINRSDPSYPLDFKGLDIELDAPTIEKRVNKAIEDTVRWKDNRTSYFIQFPGLHRIKPLSTCKSFEVDLLLSIWEYIDSELSGNLNVFYHSFPEELVNVPLFSPYLYTMDVQKTEPADTDSKNTLVNTHYDDEGNKLLQIYFPEDSGIIPLKTMDEVESRILSCFLAFIDDNFYTDKKVQIDVATLVRYVSKNKGNVSSKEYESIIKRCAKLSKYSHEIELNDRIRFFNFFDHVDFIPGDDMSAPSVIASFGEVLADAVIHKRLVSVNETALAALQLEMSRLVCFAFQKEQIRAYKSGIKSMDYSYSYFQRIVRFKSKLKKNNLALIHDCLNDFISAKVCIHNYTYTNDVFTVEFLPLTDEELADISFSNNLLPQH